MTMTHRNASLVPPRSYEPPVYGKRRCMDRRKRQPILYTAEHNVRAAPEFALNTSIFSHGCEPNLESGILFC
jgi:hypothetical protein